MDQYDALIQGAPTDAESQKALAAALRRQSILGQMYQVTGDRAIAPLGEGMQTDSNRGAQQISQERAHQEALKQALTFHNDQQTHEAAQLAEEVRNHNMVDQRSRDLAAQEAELKKALLTQKDADAAAKPGKALPAADTKPLDGLTETINHLEQARASFKPEFAGATIPGGRTLSNTLSSMGLGTSSMDAASDWWRQYGRGFKLGELHNQFGARLTQAENDLFNKYHLSENMKPDQIASTLDNLISDFKGKLSNRLANREAGGYNGDQINAYRANAHLIPTEAQGADPGAGVAAPGAPAPTGADKYRAAAKAQLTVGAQPPMLPQATGQQPIATNGMRLPTIPGMQQPGTMLTGMQ